MRYQFITHVNNELFTLEGDHMFFLSESFLDVSRKLQNSLLSVFVLGVRSAPHPERVIDLRQ